MAAATQPLPYSPMRGPRALWPSQPHETEARILAETGSWLKAPQKTVMFAGMDSSCPAPGNADLQYPRCLVTSPYVKRQKIVTSENHNEGIAHLSLNLSPKRHLQHIDTFTAMNPQPRTPNRNLRKRKSLPSASWDEFPKLGDLQGSPSPPPPLTPVKSSHPSKAAQTPPTAKKRESLTGEECWVISQKLFKHFGTEAMPAKAMLNRYLRNRIGRCKQDVLLELEDQVGPTVMRVRCTPGKKRPCQKKAPGPSRFLREKEEHDELLMYAAM